MMQKNPQYRPAHRLVVVMPTWVGDAVMATPMLRALQALYPHAHITALARQQVRPILESCPWINRIATIRPPRQGSAGHRGNAMLKLARRLASAQFDTAVLLTNSFRAALLVKMAGIPRRVGYDRDGRGFLLTDRLLPRRSAKGYVPVSTRDYYLGLAAYLGADQLDPTLELFTRPEDDARADALLREAGFDAGDPGQRLVLINPGANYGDAKMWFPERFAEVADRCVRELGAAVAVTGSPKERAILDRVLAHADEKLIDLPRLGLDLTLLKSIVHRSSLLITNDTGPRHMAAALDVPVVTIFGPTDPAWTVIDFPLERQVRVDVYCGPCQKKRCPLAKTPDELICMKRVTTDMVFHRAAALLNAASAVTAASEPAS